jgi:hypothetical protein
VRIDGYHWDDTSVGLAGMYNFPLGNAFEVYGRLGYQHSTLSPTDSEREEYDGSGILLGGGFQFKLPVAVASLSLFVDYTIAHSSLSSPSVLGTMEEGFTTRVWTLGAKLGF